MGRRIVLGWSRNGVPRSGEVVGIVRDFKQSTLDREADPQIFLPFDQAPLGYLSILVRSTSDLGTVSAAARAQVREVDPDLPLYELKTLEELVASSVSQPRFYMLLLGGFAAVALVMAAIGMYGVSAVDPAIYVAVAVVLVLVAGLASYLPARKAARTEPQLALRGEV